MLQSEIIERTPSVYFRFDDESHRNFSKSSFDLDYSISNQKYVLSNRLHQKNNQTNKIHQTGTPRNSSFQNNNQTQTKNNIELHTELCNQNSYSPLSQANKIVSLHNMKKYPIKITHQEHHQNISEDEVSKMVLSSQKKSNRLQTQEFFKQFDTKYDITFDRQNQIFVNEWIPQAENQEGSKISRGNLFDDFHPQQTLMPIQIMQKKLTNNTESPLQIHQEHTSSNFNDFIHSNENAFSSQLSLYENQKTDTKINPENYITDRNSNKKVSESNKQNNPSNNDSEFQEVISFGPSSYNQTKIRKYRQINNRHFTTKDFENNSSLLQKNCTIFQVKKRVPLKSIENIIQKNSKQNQSQQTRKKSIINADLFISTINKREKNQTKQKTNCVWSNPINNKKSSSLESSFCYDNMFKTNAFRETLKSTTLQNWKKKYHQKAESNGDKKTVTKKHRDTNIFNNLFIRA